MPSCSRRALLAGLAFVVAGPVLAQSMDQPLRTIPDEARRGRMTWVQGMDVTVDGRGTTLAPGVLVRDVRNLLVPPSAIPREAPVAYQVDLDRQIHRVWVLTREEQARPPAKR
jgi:hypothetical protein